MSTFRGDGSYDFVKLVFPSLPENIGFARTAAGIYASRLEFTLLEIEEIKVATSEAVSNAVVHGYAGTIGMITMEMAIEGETLRIDVRDDGVGIEDIEWARQPANTSRSGEEHLGLGFFFIEESVDELEIESQPGRGTLVSMRKTVGLRKGSASASAAGS